MIRFRPFGAALVAVPLLLAVPQPAQAQSFFDTRYVFAGGADGAAPEGALLADGGGGFYGTTAWGGAHGWGSVFHLTRPQAGPHWTKTTIYDFTAGGDGALPESGLVRDTVGMLYGVAQMGGSAGYGTVFALAPPGSGQMRWAERTLHAFAGGHADGSYPYGAPLLEADGSLIGLAGSVAYLLRPTAGTGLWTEFVIHRFGGAGATPPDCGNAAGPLLRAKDGRLFGTCTAGGVSGLGAVFALTRPTGGDAKWSEALLYSFGAAPDANQPSSNLLADTAGNLYGIAAFGGANQGGAIYQLSPPQVGGSAWTESPIYAFPSGSSTENGSPGGTLLITVGNTLIGTDPIGGAAAKGRIFQLSPSGQGSSNWTENDLHVFSGRGGGFRPFALTATCSATIVGVTAGTGGSGPSCNGTSCGTVFALRPAK